MKANDVVPVVEGESKTRKEVSILQSKSTMTSAAFHDSAMEAQRSAVEFDAVSIVNVIVDAVYGEDVVDIGDHVILSPDEGEDKKGK